jgi:serine phosphatase RsbU (regulator of sigma subunit)
MRILSEAPGARLAPGRRFRPRSGACAIIAAHGLVHPHQAHPGHRANTLLEKDSPGSIYVTLFAAAYELATGSLRYVNGGHPPPYRLDSAGRVFPFGEVGGPMVGLLPGTKYT